MSDAMTWNRLALALKRVGGTLMTEPVPLQEAVRALAIEFLRFATPELILAPIGHPFIRVGRENEIEYHYVELGHRPRGFAYIRFVFKVFTKPKDQVILMQAMDGTRSIHSVVVRHTTADGQEKFWDTYARFVSMTRMELWKESIGGKIPENVTK